MTSHLARKSINVRFGSLADILQRSGNVRLTPESGHPDPPALINLADDRALPHYGSCPLNRPLPSEADRKLERQFKKSF